jgi:hypothetical protein
MPAKLGDDTMPVEVTRKPISQEFCVLEEYRDLLDARDSGAFKSDAKKALSIHEQRLLEEAAFLLSHPRARVIGTMVLQHAVILMSQLIAEK